MSFIYILTLVEKLLKYSRNLKKEIRLIDRASEENNFTKIDYLLSEMTNIANEYNKFSSGELKSVIKVQPSELSRRLDAKTMLELVAFIRGDIEKTKNGKNDLIRK